MSLKKRMFRSNLQILLVTLAALFLAVGILALGFKQQFAKDFESMDHAQLDGNVMAAAQVMEQDWNENWNGLQEQLMGSQYQLIVIRDRKVVYGTQIERGKETLQEFNFDTHKNEKTEIFYTQGMTIIERYDKNTDCYLFASAGREVEWWLDPFVRSYSTFFYAILILAAFLTAVLLLLSSLFTRKMLQRIMEPLEALEAGAERIGKGELETMVQYRGDEEFERICDAFNGMQQAVLAGQKQQLKNERDRTDMIVGISHYLRTPLTSIQGYIRGVLDGIANTEEKKRAYLNTAYQSACEMNDLLQKLLDFSRMESGQMPLHVIRGDLAELAEGFIARKESGPDGEKAVFTFENAMELPVNIYMDVEQMRRIFENLLENSLKYAGTVPVKIRIKIFRKKKEVILEWEDFGKGVPEEKLPHIFERFYRCNEARTEKGSGVGLYIVRWIAEQHGGSVEAENREGLLIRLHFPEAHTLRKENTWEES